MFKVKIAKCIASMNLIEKLIYMKNIVHLVYTEICVFIDFIQFDLYAKITKYLHHLCSVYRFH